MTEQDKKLFEALIKDRKDSAKTLEKPSMRGAMNSVIDNYSDQAHFIYELLQNADDAGATSARFILEADRLIFAHNGTRLFSVSDPGNEDQDTEAGCLGDINAITSVGNSNKEPEATIGKFGVGFKSVFQYTATPHIYDPNFRFKLERYFVPVLLEDDTSERRPEETLFIFPFDRYDTLPERAYEDIKDKLKNLSYPLLFLSHLENIDFKIADIIGMYEKTVETTYLFGDVTAEFICLTQNDDEDINDIYLRLFSRVDKNARKYSVGFFTDDNGHLKPGSVPAFCFFSTKETTRLNFIIHAPFLLTNSREGIKAGEPHNIDMVNKLAELAADAIVLMKDIGEREGIRLIDDSIRDIIPFNPKVFANIDDKGGISFRPFYDSILKAFQNEEIIPTASGYARSENAYWASVPEIAELFSDEQLSDICDNPGAQWAFPSIGRDNVQNLDLDLASYIYSIVKTHIDEDAIMNGRKGAPFYNRHTACWEYSEPVKGISAHFIETQSIEWLHKFYKWLSGTKKRSDLAKSALVFLDQARHAVAAYDDKKELRLFLPVEDISLNDRITTVHQDLLRDPETKKFLEDLGIKSPDDWNIIYNCILPLYDKGEDENIDSDAHFRYFFSYYRNHCLNGDDKGFIDKIKTCKFLRYSIGDAGNVYHGNGDTMYFPTPELKKYFETKPDVRFIAYDGYTDIVGPEFEDQLEQFLHELGVEDKIRVLNVPIDDDSDREDLPQPEHYTQYCKYSEHILEGCKEILDFICENKSEEKSLLLWRSLITVIKERCDRDKRLSDLISGVCKYYFYRDKEEPFESSDSVLLRKLPWLLDKDDNFVSASQLNGDSISEKYDTSSREAEKLLSFLGIPETKSEDANLTDEQRKLIELGRKCEEAGCTEEDLEEIKRNTAKREAISRQNSNPYKADNEVPYDNDEAKEDTEYAHNQTNQKNSTNRTWDNAALYADEAELDDDIDQDEYAPAAVDYAQRLKRAREKHEQDTERINQAESWQEKAEDSPKYSYAWFHALLELEMLNSNEKNSRSREISIGFAKVEREQGTARTLLLTQPSRYIPQYMEDLADIPLALHLEDGTKKMVPIEVSNVKEYTLRVKMKDSADIEGIDLRLVTEATINAQSPVFLLEALKKGFIELGYDDEFNMRDNLCENIEFIFGPPGTGKTTYLADQIIQPLMEENPECRVLVLTPTNKAADVLVRRVMEEYGKDQSYEDWLVRFGITGDEEIEASPVYRDKEFDIRSMEKSVVVTTIARFPYDYFMPRGERLFLRDLNWDYIIIDEASMIPIVNIVYALYKKTPKKFIISGDPFQIEPISAVAQWKDENIYTMVNLSRRGSFTKPETCPHPYEIVPLTTQYRSVPEVGEIFSKFTYDGVLKHHRATDSQKPLEIDIGMEINPINIIKFPTSKYESIYRAKRLNKRSSYQIYAALFTYEFVCWLAKKISLAYSTDLYKIGVIAPYRAQADLIDKLLASERFPDNVEVQAGTIHGFQGDECDIILAVFNTPPSISESKGMFLNKQNIINVAISRARDYLFIIMPDDDADNIENLELIEHLQSLIKSTDKWTEAFTPNLEQSMFGSETYLEDNTFSTSHQSVNVYGLPEKRYEVRTENSAVDIQIHRAYGVNSKH